MLGDVRSHLADRFLKQRFARHRPDLIETNITRWRRTVCGDLTAAFDFKTPNQSRIVLPDTSSYEPPDHERHPDYVPTPPTAQALPLQERGVRRARAIPYELSADGTVDAPHGAFRIDFANTGEADACFQVRAGNRADGPRTYTVEAASRSSTGVSHLSRGVAVVGRRHFSCRQGLTKSGLGGRCIDRAASAGGRRR